jgi:hypothetical protein
MKPLPLTPSLRANARERARSRRLRIGKDWQPKSLFEFKTEVLIAAFAILAVNFLTLQHRKSSLPPWERLP